jgi:hypothetical protein
MPDRGGRHSGLHGRRGFTFRDAGQRPDSSWADGGGATLADLTRSSLQVLAYKASVLAEVVDRLLE